MAMVLGHRYPSLCLYTYIARGVADVGDEKLQ